MAMNGKRFTLLTGLALLGSLAVGVQADANYSYSSVLTINSGTGGGVIANSAAPGGTSTYTLADGTQLQFQNIVGSLFIVGAPLTPNIANVGIVPTTPNPGDTFSVTYTDVVTITNPSPGGATGTFTVTGTLSATNVALTGGLFSGTTQNVYSAPTSPVTISVGGATFTLVVSGTPNVGYATPTIGQPVGGAASGSLSASLVSSAIPEPASVIMVGLGLVGVAGFGLRRRAA